MVNVCKYTQCTPELVEHDGSSQLEVLSSIIYLKLDVFKTPIAVMMPEPTPYRNINHDRVKNKSCSLPINKSFIPYILRADNKGMHNLPIIKYNGGINLTVCYSSSHLE